MLPRKSILFSLIFSFLSCLAFSQAENNNFILSSNAHIGIILAPRDIQPILKKNPVGIELNYIIPTHGKRRWERVYHYPEMGLTFLYFDFGNPEQLGKGYSIFPFINFNLYKNTVFSLRFKLGSSIGYVTKKFDPIDNPANLAIGSHFNGFANLRLNSTIRLTDHFRIETGIGLTHFSNGAMNLPNAGMNVVSYNLGIGYHFYPKNVKLLPDTFTPPDRLIHFTTYAAAGMCVISRTDESKYPAGIISVNLERYVGCKSKWNAGLDMIYSTARLTETKADTSIHNYKNSQNIQLGIKAGYSFLVDRLSFPVEMGVFLYSKPMNGYFFHRIGVRYRVSDHFILGVTLKTQWAVADFFEFGFGYTFPMNKKKHGPDPACEPR